MILAQKVNTLNMVSIVCHLPNLLIWQRKRAHY